MAPKSPKNVIISDKTSSYESEITTSIISQRTINLSVTLKGEAPGPEDWHFFVLFDGQIILEGKWEPELLLELEELPVDLKDPTYQAMIADKPLILILRAIGGKPVKALDPLTHVDNRAGATVDLSPLLLGVTEVLVKARLCFLFTAEESGCKVIVHATIKAPLEITEIPLVITLVSAHCLPAVKEGTAYVGAVGLDNLFTPVAANFGLSVSNPSATKIVWATASTGGVIANTAYNIPNEDKFVPDDLELKDASNCISVYWNAMKRVLVDPSLLRDRLGTTFLVEVAGVPLTGKTEVRGRFMGVLDAATLLEPGEYSILTCAKLKYYAEAELPENVGPLLELPPTSAKPSARDTDVVLDAFGHNAYIVVRFSVSEPLIAKANISSLYETIGFAAPEGTQPPPDELHVEPPPEDTIVDVRHIRKEGGALAVHKELSTLACRGQISMNQSIKRSAANRLLMRVRAMLKQFPPGDCSYIDWQDTVTGQHAAARRAVTASFAPQPPPRKLAPVVAAARSRMAGDMRLAEKHISNNLEVSSNHPRILLSKVLRCLEVRSDQEAKDYLLRAINSQKRSKYLLWIYSGLQFDKGEEEIISARAALRIAVKGDHADGTGNAIGWAALHALNHYDDNQHAAFISARKMRKSYELKKEWKAFLERWENTSGEEEVYWIPGILNIENPMLLAAGFFLCLRCYSFSERLLQCYEGGCGTRGSRRGLVTKITPDLYYLRAASFLLRRHIDHAMEITEAGIKRFGPSPIMSQMRTTCLMCARGWDGECESALKESDRAGAEVCVALLLHAALGGMKTNPEVALQRAARAHKLAPSAHSALAIGRIFDRLDEPKLAERWAAAAVKNEPLLADGWAFLALLAMKERYADKARTMLRTARQAGPVSPDMEDKLRRTMDIVKIEVMSDVMSRNLCLCDYLN